MILCKNKGGHEHKMDKLMAGAPNPGEDHHSAKSEASKAGTGQDDPNKQGQKPPKPHLEMYLNTFMHAVHCRNANCNYPKCIQFKRVVTHSKQCTKYKNSQCDFCRQLLALCIYHAKTCKDDHCQVPFCASIKLKLKQQKAFNSQAERRRMLMMNKTLRQSANHAAMNANNPGSPEESGQGGEQTSSSTAAASSSSSSASSSSATASNMMNTETGQMSHSNSSNNMNSQMTG